MQVEVDKPWLMLGDCLEMMQEIPDGSVDMVLCDLPYGTTACKWDSIIPFEPLWAQYDRVVKNSGAIVLTSGQPFTSSLVMSNPSCFKFEWIWDKRRGGNFFSAKSEPLRVHESVVVFAKGKCRYFPQMNAGEAYRRLNVKDDIDIRAYGKQRRIASVNEGVRYPRSIIPIGSRNNGKLHPTQKPVALAEYLIRTYTKEGEIVLDNCMGSGTTGVSCINTGRRFIGIEKDPAYFETAALRIDNHIRQKREAVPDLFAAAD